MKEPVKNAENKSAPSNEELELKKEVRENRPEFQGNTERENSEKSKDSAD